MKCFQKLNERVRKSVDSQVEKTMEKALFGGTGIGADEAAGLGSPKQVTFEQASQVVAKAGFRISPKHGQGTRATPTFDIEEDDEDVVPGDEDEKLQALFQKRRFDEAARTRKRPNVDETTKMRLKN